MVIQILVLSFLGLLISIYATIVRHKSKNNRKYKPICDFKENISCTGAFSSKYGKLIGVSNSIVGIVFYLLVLILSYLGFTKYILYLSLFAFIGSLYLGYLSYFKLKNFCFVCTAIYIINFLLLITSYFIFLADVFV